ncbi:hypothetical protein LCGC14_0450050 [marine sediment metagenome]|uniref:Inner membrane protein n=1 Tax=marine sediment metagenome TaxID=412755 RepID=A0A0F9SNJ8_9ZZZZ
MKVLRFIAIIMIFGGVSAAWLALGTTMWARTEDLDHTLSQEMRSLWGPETLMQTSPYVADKGDAKRTDAGAAAPSSSTITVDITHDSRYKGLLWFSTFSVVFDGTYSFDAVSAFSAGSGAFICELPRGVTGYDGLSVELNGVAQSIPISQISSGRITLSVDRSVAATVRVHYVTKGQDVWLYSPSGASMGGGSRGEGLWGPDDGDMVPSGKSLVSLADFSLTVNTNFANIDYPRGTLSPNTPASSNNGGVTAVWSFDNALTKQGMGIVMPRRPNAGPIAMRMSLFAPVSLFFFFAILFTVVVLKKIPLHPMHYLFVAAAFFAFHVLLAYLVDKISIHTGFWICAAVSVLLVVSYMRLVAGAGFAVIYVGAAQLVYLVGFSYAFFYPGWTGLSVIVAAVITLFVLMQCTGRLDWFKVFGRGNGPTSPPAPPRVAPDGTGAA